MPNPIDNNTKPIQSAEDIEPPEIEQPQSVLPQTDLSNVTNNGLKRVTSNIEKISNKDEQLKDVFKQISGGIFKNSSDKGALKKIYEQLNETHGLTQKGINSGKKD
jgi:hypothetical protein